MEIALTHEVMNRIYKNANDFHEYLKVLGVEHLYEFFPKNYLNISGRQELQEYPIPVISFPDNGRDIGFNLDALFFEFFIPKESLLSVSLADILNFNHKVEVYGAKSCLSDFLSENDTEEVFKIRIKKSDETYFGLAFYLSYNSNKFDEILSDFESIKKIIRIDT